MSQQNSPLLIIILPILFGCAAQAPATGGPVDKQGPSLISVHPDNNTLNIAAGQKITFTFNELLDPVSIPASIYLENDLEYNLKIRGRRIIIRPNPSWPQDELVRINLSRKIRDYQKNMMAAPILLIFSTGTTIPQGSIEGKIIGYDQKNIVEIGLYKWPLSDSSRYFQKAEADENGNFQFGFIEYGDYTIAGIEGTLSDFGKQMENKRYTMLPFDFVQISPEKPEIEVALHLSEPLKRLKITSVEILSQYSVNLLMNDQSKELFIVDTSYSPEDTVFVNMEKSNRLETYVLPEFSFFLPEITDTLAPKFETFSFEDHILSLVFSEPVNIDPEGVTASRDTIDFSLPFEYKNTFTVLLPNLADSITQLKLIGEKIRDWNGNIFKDSVKSVSIPKKPTEETIIGGNILGSIAYDGNLPILIEAQKIDSDALYSAEVKNNKFQLENLSSGLYELWGFEILNNQNPQEYFSGIWSPYQRAARFTIYPDTVDVRARWDVEAILIDFE